MQFPKEEEVLFPPCTLMTVKSERPKPVADSTEGKGPKTSERMSAVNKDGRQFSVVRAVPSFV